MKRKPKPEPWPPANLSLPDAETLGALSDTIDAERRKQAEVNEEIRRNGGVYDPICKRWIPKR